MGNTKRADEFFLWELRRGDGEWKIATPRSDTLLEALAIGREVAKVLGEGDSLRLRKRVVFVEDATVMTTPAKCAVETLEGLRPAPAVELAACIA